MRRSAAWRRWAGLGVLATEMESAALYLEAMRAGKQALCLCTVVDNPYTGEQATGRGAGTVADGHADPCPGNRVIPRRTVCPARNHTYITFLCAKKEETA